MAKNLDPDGENPIETIAPSAGTATPVPDTGAEACSWPDNPRPSCHTWISPPPPPRTTYVPHGDTPTARNVGSVPVRTPSPSSGLDRTDSVADRVREYDSLPANGDAPRTVPRVARPIPTGTSNTPDWIPSTTSNAVREATRMQAGEATTLTPTIPPPDPLLPPLSRSNTNRPSPSRPVAEAEALSGPHPPKSATKRSSAPGCSRVETHTRRSAWSGHSKADVDVKKAAAPDGSDPWSRTHPLSSSTPGSTPEAHARASILVKCDTATPSRRVMARICRMARSDTWISDTADTALRTDDDSASTCACVTITISAVSWSLLGISHATPPSASSAKACSPRLDPC